MSARLRIEARGIGRSGSRYPVHVLRLLGAGLVVVVSTASILSLRRP